MALDPTALFTLSYGLYVLTAREGDRDCGCIVNTVTQLTENPTRIALSVNKQNFTNEVIQRTGVFNVSVLTEAAPMDLFRRFGFQSGRDVDKFAGRTDPTSENGLRYICLLYTSHLVRLSMRPSSRSFSPSSSGLATI